MSAPPPRLDDRYEIGDLIGRGGMADVYRAHDTVLDRSVAVKVLRDLGSPDTRRFDDEARLLATLDDDAVVTLLDTGVTDDRPWLALELVEGSTLREVMEHGPVDPDVVQRIGRDVASGLAHAHDRGVVHRDVKPGNILLTHAGAAKLTDFGIARLDGTVDGATLTGHTIGTAAYLSPEQLRAGPVTGAADVYALGLVLLEALTAVRAYPGPVTEAALARLHHCPLIPTSLPPGWSGLLAAMTAMDPEVRPSAADVARRLGVAQFPSGAADLTSTVQVRVDRPAGRRLRALGVAAALVLAVSLTLAQSLSGEAPAVAGTTAPDRTERSAASSSTFSSARSDTAAVRTTAAPASPAPPTSDVEDRTGVASRGSTAERRQPRASGSRDGSRVRDARDVPTRTDGARPSKAEKDKAPKSSKGKGPKDKGPKDTGPKAPKDKGPKSEGPQDKGPK